MHWLFSLQGTLMHLCLSHQSDHIRTNEFFKDSSGIKKVCFYKSKTLKILSQVLIRLGTFFSDFHRHFIFPHIHFLNSAQVLHYEEIFWEWHLKQYAAEASHAADLIDWLILAACYCTTLLPKLGTTYGLLWNPKKWSTRFQGENKSPLILPSPLIGPHQASILLLSIKEGSERMDSPQPLMCQLWLVYGGTLRRLTTQSHMLSTTVPVCSLMVHKLLKLGNRCCTAMMNPHSLKVAAENGMLLK